jgi:ribosomal protein S18 acetylase RimI-like enzyme
MTIENSTKRDAEEILKLQKLAYRSEAEIYSDFTIQPVTQTLEETLGEFERQIVLKYEGEKGIIGSVRGYFKDGTAYIGKLIVHPQFQNTGIGSMLMKEIEARFPAAGRFEIFTGFRSSKNLHIYNKLGYRQFNLKVINYKLTLIFLEKFNKPQQSPGPG